RRRVDLRGRRGAAVAGKARRARPGVRRDDARRRIHPPDPMRRTLRDVLGHSTLYPMLYNLEAKGLVEGREQEAESGRVRRYYRLPGWTPGGPSRSCAPRSAMRISRVRWSGATRWRQHTRPIARRG